MTAKHRILLIDDDAAMLRLMSLWLGEAGYSVQCAGDGEAALALLNGDCPHFVITDWDMPRMDGLELCQRLRQQKLPHYVYTVLVTGKSRPEEIVQGLEAGADDYLVKPVHRVELLARVRAGGRLLELESRLAELARTDPLTGVPTQRVFYEAAEKEVERVRRYRLPLSCVMLDVDFFKRINDTYGHPVGDQTLRRVARLLAESCRVTDSLCRYGGEEFCVLLPETNEHDAALWADRVRRALSAEEFAFDHQPVRVTASFGVAALALPNLGAAELVDRADQALLVAKQTGRDRVVCYSTLDDRTLRGRLISPCYDALFHEVQAQDVMTSLVAPLLVSESIRRAADYFINYRISSAPVVDEEGRMVGIVSERDLMQVEPTLGGWAQPVSDVMKTNVVCYAADTPITIIYQFLCRVTIRAVVVIDEGQPVGVISRGTFLRWFGNRLRLAEAELAPEAFYDVREQRQELARESAAQLVQAISHHAAIMERALSQESADLTSPVVGAASRMQDMLLDLLSWSRYLHAPLPPATVLPRDGADEVEFAGWPCPELLPPTTQG
ncbi:MAG: diguanylate cyclase [Pirellulales bacterium]